MTPERLFGALSDSTRLRAIMLIQSEGELCVCELTHALEESQPKISRHLATLRDAGIVTARRSGTWMHYRVNPELPAWARRSLERVYPQLHGLERFAGDRARLRAMAERPGEPRCA
ncbi:MAG: metalloregulator ArsR/SmtB family transcription factor [Xanthomonadales bacterium]